MTGGLILGALTGCNLETEVGKPAVLVPNNIIDYALLTGSWTDESKEVASFKGIKYAKAPVGGRRFAPPVNKKLTGEFEATEFGSSCPQIPSGFGEPSVNEDCLYLNVYSPG